MSEGASRQKGQYLCKESQVLLYLSIINKYLLMQGCNT